MTDGNQDTSPSQSAIEVSLITNARRWPRFRKWAAIGIVAIAAIVIAKLHWQSNEPLATFASASRLNPDSGWYSTFTVLPNGKELLIATRTDSKHEIYVGDFLLETCELTGRRESRSLGFRLLREEKVRARGGRLNFSVHGNDIVLTDWEYLRILDPATIDEKFKLPTPSPRPHTVQFSPDGKWLASIPDPRSLVNSFSTSHEVLLCNVTARMVPETLRIEEVRSISFSADSRFLVCATFEDCLLYDLEKRESISLTPNRPRNDLRSILWTVRKLIFGKGVKLVLGTGGPLMGGGSVTNRGVLVACCATPALGAIDRPARLGPRRHPGEMAMQGPGVPQSIRPRFRSCVGQRRPLGRRERWS